MVELVMGVRGGVEFPLRGLRRGLRVFLHVRPADAADRRQLDPAAPLALFRILARFRFGPELDREIAVRHEAAYPDAEVALVEIGLRRLPIDIVDFHDALDGFPRLRDAV